MTDHIIYILRDLLYVCHARRLVIEHSPFDRLRMTPIEGLRATPVMVSLSNQGFPLMDCGNDGLLVSMNNALNILSEGGNKLWQRLH